MSSKYGQGKIEVKQDDFEGDIQIKENGSYLNIEDDYEIPNNFRKIKIGTYKGKFKTD